MSNICDVCSVTMGSMATPSSDLMRLLRWEDAGGTWQVATLRVDAVTLSLQRCDAGEEVDRLASTAADVIEHVRRALGPAELAEPVDDDLRAPRSRGTLEE